VTFKGHDSYLTCHWPKSRNVLHISRSKLFENDQKLSITSCDSSPLLNCIWYTLRSFVVMCY